MQTRQRAAPRAANLDSESRVIIYQGASVNQLGEIFGLRPQEVMRRLVGLDPVATGTMGNPIYSVRDAAPKLIRMEITEKQIIDYMEKLNPKQLPPMLSKEFWSAMQNRAKYRESAGELWMTTDVLAVASEAFQSLRMSLLLIPDSLRDETEISEQQVLLVQRVIDDALEQARVRLIADLRKPSGSRSRSDAADGEL